jgi:hypothetical protein
MRISVLSPAGWLLLTLLWLLAAPTAWAQAPTLTTVSPRGALVGEQITLTGTGFTGATGLSLAGTAVTGYTVVSDTQIRFNVPTGASTGLLTVTTAAGTSNGRPLEVGDLRSLAVTGFTGDVVANGTGVTATASTSSTFDAGSDVLHELGYNNGTATAGTGLPAGGFFVGTAASAPGVPYQLADYAGSNSLRLPNTGTGSGTLTLATPTPAVRVYVLAASANGSSTVDVTATFTDNTTQTFAGLSVADWGASGSNPALTGLGRTARASSVISAPAGQPQLYQFELRLSLANATKLLQSLTFAKTSATGVLNVLAVSYLLPPPPPTITGFSPISGPPGTPITVTGTNLGTVQQVRVNGQAGTVTGTPTAGSFTFVVSVGSTSGPLSVGTYGGAASSSGSFTVAAGLYVTALSPARNQRNASASSAVALTFSEALRNDAATRGSLTVFSQQRGGRLTDGSAGGSTTVSGSTLSFDPTTDFQPGETVFSTVTTAARNSAGTLSPAAGHVSQFTVATGGGGRGGLVYASQVALGGSFSISYATDLAVGDVDGDGDPDVVAVANTTTGQVLLNDGSGTFGPGSTVALTGNQRKAELADLDGDGDLDLLVLSLTGETVFVSGTATLSLRLNDGTGTFGGGQDVVLARAFSGLAVGDVDGDGDLDAALWAPPATTYGTCELRICRNTAGTLALGAAQAVSGSGYALALADLDNDGDLDIAATGTAASGPNAGQYLLVLWNGGDASGSNPGTFSNPLLADVGSLQGASCIKAADLDNDGDLDLVLTGNIGGTFLAVNGGDATGANVGTFGPAGGRPGSNGAYGGYLSVGDVDADGDLDMVTAAYGAQNTLNLSRNGGNAAGTNAGQFRGVGSSSTLSGAVRNTFACWLADLDGDGDLDLVAANPEQMGVWLNRTPPLLTTASPNPVARGAALVLTGQYLTGVTSFRLNGVATNTGFTVNSDTQLTLTVPTGGAIGSLTLSLTSPAGTSNTLTVDVVPPATLTAVSPAAELPGLPVELTGTGFTSSTAVSFGGVPAGSMVLNSPTSITAVVPAGALPAGSAPVVVSYAGASSSQPFAALEVYDGGTLGSCGAAVPATASVADGQWHYLLSTSGQVVAAYNYNGTSLGDFALDLLRADPAQPVRQTSSGGKYLDRNWHLTASGGTFAGRTVQLRLYGLATELARLRAADAAATPVALRATQYSGPNEDCQLGNDNFTTGEVRNLAAPATAPGGASWFVSELAVPDHFSEFYLTGSSGPLPVELTSFTAAAEGPAVRLAWATASEKNSARFDIERSADGKAFARIGEQQAQGTQAGPTRYAFLDSTIPPTQQSTRYYRLRLLDQDGTFSYSPVRTVFLTSSLPHSLTVFPNPTHGAATLTGAQPGSTVTVTDALGRPVATATADAAGTAALVLPAGAPAGVYVVRAGTRAVRLTVE